MVGGVNLNSLSFTSSFKPLTGNRSDDGWICFSLGVECGVSCASAYLNILELSSFFNSSKIKI
jgi:hypothetical protein